MVHWLILVRQGKRFEIAMPTWPQAFRVMTSLALMPGQIEGDYVAYQRLPEGTKVTG